MRDRLVGRLEDRVAALLGLDAGMGGPAVDGQAQVDGPLARADTMSPLARAHSRTKQASDSSGELADVRRRGRRADLLVRVGDEHEPLEREVGRLVVIARPERAQRERARGARPAGRTSCRSRRARGRSRRRSGTGAAPAVPSGKTVSMWPMSRTRGPPGASVERADDRVAEGRRSGRTLDRRAEPLEERGAVQRPTWSTPGLGVAAAVDVDQRRRGPRGSAGSSSVDDLLELGELVGG